jgi:hypothetical protein
MKTLDKAGLLKAGDLPKEAIALPRDAGHVWIRSMRADERSELETMHAQLDVATRPWEFRFALLLRTVCDDTGAPMLAADDEDALKALAADTVETMFEAACRLNGFSKAEIDEQEKN